MEVIWQPVFMSGVAQAMRMDLRACAFPNCLQMPAPFNVGACRALNPCFFIEIGRFHG